MGLWGSGFRVQSLGFGVWGLGFRGLGFRVAALSSARRVASAKAVSLCSLSMDARRSSLCGRHSLSIRFTRLVRRETMLKFVQGGAGGASLKIPTKIKHTGQSLEAECSKGSNSNLDCPKSLPCSSGGVSPKVVRGPSLASPGLPPRPLRQRQCKVTST